jgi:hypothetical protein
MLIRKNNQNKVTSNFTEAEYFAASFGIKENEFDFSPITVSGVQIIRDYFGVPMKLTATKRSIAHELSKGRSGDGQHPKGNATDFVFLGPQAEQTLLKYHQEILNQGELFKRLRQAGIKGFGLYDNFNHIDSRPEGGKSKDENGTFAFWDNRITTKKKIPTITEVYEAYNDKEDGSEDFKTAKNRTGWLVGILIFGALLFYYIKTRK